MRASVICILATVFLVLGLASCAQYTASSTALAALATKTMVVNGVSITVTFTQVNGIGYYYNPSAGPAATSGGPTVTRGILILPEDNVDTEAYAPAAQTLAFKGYFVALLASANQDVSAVSATVRKVLAQNPKEFWSVIGHGKGGQTASQLVQAFFPKIKGLGLVSSSVAPNVDLSNRVLPATTLYGTNDNVVAPAVSQFDVGLRLPYSAYNGSIAGANHGSFAYITTEFDGDGVATITKDAFLAAVTDPLTQIIALAHYPEAMKEVLHYAGLPNNSPYEVAVPNTRQNYYYTEGQGSVADKSWHVFQPFYPTKAAYIHYTGAACPEQAYFKLASDLADRGVTVFVPRLSLNYGSLGYKISDLIIAAHPNITNWSIGGHSYGAIAASSYIQYKPSAIKGFLLFAGNVCGTCNFTNYDIKAIQMWGSRDTIGVGVASRFKDRVIAKLPADTIYHEIQGGNHYLMGYYGYQYPDSTPTITREEQHAEMVEKADLLLTQFK